MPYDLRETHMRLFWISVDPHWAWKILKRNMEINHYA